jgi:serine protease Do
VACSSFDGQLVRRDKEVEEVLERFVCVRVVQANAMDLTLFQFDYDLTFAAFFLNADKTIYGRFGSRSDQKQAEKDISLEGFRKSMLSALDLHKNYPANRASLQGKQPVPVKFKVPEEFPSLSGKYKATIDYEGKVAQSCIHCHQVRDAERILTRKSAQPIPDQTLFPWPMPNVVGLVMDPKEKARILEVIPASAAAKTGCQAGDEIVSIEGQAIVSTADIQWVLHHAASPAAISIAIKRGGKPLSLRLALEDGWRLKSDLAWRTTTWDLRRMAAGGLVLKDSPLELRREANLGESNLALRVTYVGQYNDHAAAKRAGFQVDDIIVRADGNTNHMTESTLFRYLLQKRMPGTSVPVTVLRAGNAIDLQMPMQ